MVSDNFVKVYKEKDFVKNQWSGGMTEELFIYPDSSSYEKRDFIFRLSKATIDAEKTKFTKVDGYRRHLVLLSGDVTLVSDSKKSKKLKDLSTFVFSGSDETESFGRGTDYNLMVKEESQSSLEVYELREEGQSVSLPSFMREGEAFICLYCHKGYSVIGYNDTKEYLKESEQLVIKASEADEVVLMGEGVVIGAYVAFDEVEYFEDKGKKPVSLDDIKASYFIAYTSFRGAKFISKKRRNLWYDPLLSKSIKKAEKFYITFILYFVGLFFAFYLDMEKGTGAILWTLLYLLVILPLSYLIFIPKPVRDHMIPISDLKGTQKKIYDEGKEKNPQAERILKKYRITGRNEGDDHKGRSYGSFK